VDEALSLWEERERKRAEFLATLDDAKASLARGEGRIIARPYAVLGANHMQRDWDLSGNEAESRKALEHLHGACELAIAAIKAIATSLKAKRSFTIK